MEFKQSDEFAWKQRQARLVLTALPEWFGIPESVEAYALKTAENPALFAMEGDRCVGFVTYLVQTPYAAEVCVIGVLPGMHRHGIGGKLIDWCLDRARSEGRRYVTCKTLAETNSDPYYRRTRAFYAAKGFLPLEILPTLWDEENPCLLMIREISQAAI